MNTMTSDQIKAFRAELMADPCARITDAPHACTRALAVAKGRHQKAAKAKAIAVVIAAHAMWVASGRDGARAIALAVDSGAR